MNEELILTLGQTAILAGLGVLGLLVFRNSGRPLFLAGGLLLYVFYAWLDTRLFFALPNWPADARWNWLGKAMSFTGMLIVAALPVFGYRRCGITPAHEKGAWTAYLVLAVLALSLGYLAAQTGDGRPDDVETIAFQWTMPGLDEELFYRGVLLLCLNEAFPRTWRIAGAPLGYGGFLTCVLFGLVHALAYGDGEFSFSADAFLMTGGPSVLLLWMRERTGNLLAPLLGHNLANGIFTLF